jgi:hypothetical protein
MNTSSQMTQPTLALVVVLILLSFKLAAAGLEHWPYLRNQAKLSSLPRALSVVLGLCIWVLGSVVYARNHYTVSASNDRCTTADADIIGDGVRAATWTQVVILLLLAITGSFNTEHNAIQELGAGLLVTHIALVVALLAPMASKELSPVDSIFGTMILDAQNSALSIQLVAKQTLASRWQTFTVILGQLAGLAAIGLLINNFTTNGLATDECNCLPAFWWGWLNNCADGTPNDHRAIWVYYAIRITTVLLCCAYAVRNTFSFDEAKRREEEYPCAKCRQCKNGKNVENSFCCRCVTCDKCEGCRKCNAKRCSSCSTNKCRSCENWRLHNRCEHCSGTMDFKEGKGWVRGYKYSQLPASTSFLFIEASLYSLFSLLAAEGLMATYGIRPSSPIKSVGQMTSIVIAAATGIRAVWVCLSLFLKKGSSEAESGQPSE